ncbi:PREDICTED: uncharacterized protein LOC109586776 [Amphimedon queenslandica]|uniref:Fibronectin type-III domain-containing protein n=1 Tax=Amphimedon queenslandica TaxID=400682 RepID=A0AAN0JNE7_AMPQE|nr:PREDICTED: uncharacterized protein LOC109586776 [Amphimedon queenslandica]|eukprot:XP_019858543.1 PREDICTED: uncharacterized protein LOC109586776 [Amphimedon queenslandica]
MTFLYAYLFTFVLQSTHCANITLQPVSINTTLNSTVVFSCEAVANDLSFRVNNTPATDTNVTDKGFSVTTSSNGGTIRAELQALAYDHNNNTEVRCRAITDEPLQVEFSDTAILMIQDQVDRVSTQCRGEYPNSITVNILNTDDAVIKNTSIPTQVNDQLMITGVITVPNNLNTFIVNVSLSNNGGEYLPTPSFGFGFLGPVTNIDSSIDNCSTIDITWTAPTVDDRVSILYYNLSIYDDITDQFLRNEAVYDTSYQFKDEELFRHRYTYVITGVNELGEGISNNDTFSYQRVPRSVTEAGSDIIKFNETSATTFYISTYQGVPRSVNSTVFFSCYTLHFNIPVTIECTGEVPENATVTIQCNGTGVVYDNTELVEYAKQPICTSSSTGTATSSSSGTVTVSPTSSSSVLIISIPAGGGGVCFGLIVLIVCCLILCCVYFKNRKRAAENHEFLDESTAFDGGQFNALYVQVNDQGTTTGAIGGGAAKEPIYSELGVAPPTTKLAKPEAPSVEYAKIDKTVPKATAQSQSNDDVVVSASGTTVIGATGGDPPPIPDKKNKGAAATGQGGTNGETDAARNLPHHVNDDSHFSSPPPPPLPPSPCPPLPVSWEGVQPNSTAADQATGIETTGTGLVSYL